MYLKTLTLKGFKSFAQPTTFAFEQGVTCVVGPNGSGKSNVVDGLAWVMGEQGAKTLRGGRMEDVIFAGTATKGPLGRAEVLLTIDNSDGALPIEYTEVTISRTLFRNGGSEYAINGEACRLLDVQELLSDSGLGREMHVIVGQGQLDQVLHATPEERRGFIEEAAGILKHRRRKEKTIRKLEAMEANLTRLSDLAGELRRQLKPLGQQAQIAKEAQSIAAIVRDAKARLLADEIVGIRSNLAFQGKNEAERKSERIVLQERIDQNRLRIQHLERAQIGDAVDVARQTSFALESVQGRLRSLFTLANQRIALLASPIEETNLQLAVTPDQIEAIHAELERLNAEINLAETAFEEHRQASVRTKSELDAVDADLAQQTALISKQDLRIAELTGASETAKSRLAALNEEATRLEGALESARWRQAGAESELAELDSDQTGSDQTLDLDGAFKTAQSQVTSAEEQIESVRSSLHALEQKRAALLARVSALSAALDEKDGSTSLLERKLPGLIGLVAEHIKVEAGFEIAISAALGSLSDAVLVESFDDGISAITAAIDGALGRVEVLVARPPRSTSQALDLNLPRGAVTATSVVDAPTGVLELLSRTIIADDLEVARAAWKALPTGSEANIITKAGDVLSRFVLRGGSGAKRSRVELTTDRDLAKSDLVKVESEIESASKALADQKFALETARALASAALLALREFDAGLAAQSERLATTRANAQAAASESERLLKSLQAARSAAEDAEHAANSSAIELEKVVSEPRPIIDASLREPLVQQVERALQIELESRLQLETLRERVRMERDRGQQLAQQLEAQRAAANEAARRAVLRRAQLESANRVVEALPTVLDAVDKSVSEAKLALASREAERSKQNQELISLREQDSGLREQLSVVSESMHGLEMQIYEKKLHLSALLERAGEELGLVEEVLIAEYGPEVPIVSEDPEADPQVFDRREQEIRLERAQRKLDQLGRVNPLALEEFEALEQRHKFLTEQLTDLTNTRKDLLTIIDELDGRMKEIFAEAFEDTRAAFHEVFPVLFPGGTGNIQLSDPDDLLTTGIEVTVKPAGKKIERLSLLSGGERSLAAIALLVAIFKARPSPFYILDEVEAALDDANLGRLLTVFEELRASSQLIVITHQKRTMEIADALYGVSMRQDGVSAVVGQRVAER